MYRCAQVSQRYRRKSYGVFVVAGLTSEAYNQVSKFQVTRQIGQPRVAPTTIIEVVGWVQAVNNESELSHYATLLLAWFAWPIEYSALEAWYLSKTPNPRHISSMDAVLCGVLKA